MLCTPTGAAEGWARRDLELAGLDEQTRRWLGRHQLEADLWVASVAADWADCPFDARDEDVFLVLQEGAPGADRVGMPVLQRR